MSDKGQGPRYHLDIEGTIHPWDRPTVSAAEISTLGGWALEEGVIEIDLKTQVERTLASDEQVELKPGMGFSRKVVFKRGNAG